jgi:hypothetical protein
MKEGKREFLGMNQLGDIWSEAYIDWAEDWTDAYAKEREIPLSCCGLDSSMERNIFL